MKQTKCLIINLVIFYLLGLLLFFRGYFIDRRYLLDTTEGKMKPTQPVIFLIIDSFRIDLAVSQHFTFFKNMTENKPDQSLFFLSFAEVPTVTGPRLQAMTSGNFPPLSKLLDNFHASEIKEDNIMFQMNKFNKKTLFSGDDTWIGLYPDQFTVKFPQKSFNIGDMHSVDQFNCDKILENLDKGFDLIVSHFLGLDHAGHKNNKVLNNPDLNQKLSQLDQIIALIYEKMPNDTVLIVAGDHGMANDGNHGGNSTEETNTLFFATRKQGKFYPNYMKHIPELQDNYQSPLINQTEYIRKISQIDIVPTLATLLGVPIPFSNLGYLMNEFFNSEEHCLNNLKQVWHFVETVHSRQGKFSYFQKSQWQTQYSEVKTCKDALILMNDIQAVSRKIWNEYDIPLLNLSFVLQGLIVVFFILVMVILFQAQQNDDLITIQQITAAFKHVLQNNKKSSIVLAILSIFLFLLYELEILITFLLIVLIAYIDFGLLLKVKKNHIQNLNQYQWDLIETPDSIKLNNRFSKLLQTAVFFFFLYKIFLQGNLLLSIQQKKFEERYLYNEIIQLIVLSSVIGIFNFISRLIDTQEDSSTLFKVKDVIISCISAIIIYFALNFEQFYLTFQHYEILNQSFYMLYLPVIFLHGCLFMYHKKSPILDKIIAQAGLILIDIFYIYPNAQMEDQPYKEWVVLHIPKIIYIISIYYYFSKDPIFLMLSCIVVSDKYGLAIYSYEILIFICIYYHWRNLVKFSLLSFFAMISLICQITWFIFGNRCTISSIKVDRAFVGVKEFHLWLNPLILTLFLLGPYLIGLIFIKYIGPKLCKYGELNERQVKNSNNLFKLMFLFNFYLQVQFTQIHSYENAGGLIDVQFKYIFDSVTLLIVSLLMLLI
ncbi:unnamed protein product (macronuclear) [Paramecium tetraurelia]|uniref:GPI ethanolamine phosphate transferase 3 n=1 Tax=Paramecium tetraurelia TaxID=5888 RepID=A0DP71_PARTE|nr:uncharacterized protein GSPATT00019020001 [Paramecium tetraurelia]CAK84838.1 unnamed protein product [Paramecium tetraurelia]|eukprot:XP_001452235.1 hypothetical protein (macronuclear) [Paramecium tetraurelia strain d4-2]